MIIKILSPVFIALGWYLYVLFDHGNAGAVRWPGVSLIAIGLLLIPIFHLVSFKKGSIALQSPKSGLFKLALVFLAGAIACLSVVFLSAGFNGLIWLIPAGILALGAVLMLLASLYVKGKP